MNDWWTALQLSGTPEEDPQTEDRCGCRFQTLAWASSFFPSQFYSVTLYNKNKTLQKQMQRCMRCEEKPGDHWWAQASSSTRFHFLHWDNSDRRLETESAQRRPNKWKGSASRAALLLHSVWVKSGEQVWFPWAGWRTQISVSRPIQKEHDGRKCYTQHGR